MNGRDRLVGEIEVDGLVLAVKRAIEFWPLIGDQTSVRETSRLVDPSTSRIEVTVRARDGRSLEGVVLGIDGYRLELAAELDGADEVAVLSVCYRAWVASPALHPTLAVHGPVAIEVIDSQRRSTHVVTYHGWRPDGEAYDGVPEDLETAEARRRERLVVESHRDADPARLAPLPLHARTDHTVDTRRLSSAERG